MIYLYFVVLKFLLNRSAGSVQDFFKGFYHIWAWWPFWSCDLDYLYKHCFPVLEKTFENMDTQIVARRLTRVPSYKLPMSLWFR